MVFWAPLGLGVPTIVDSRALPIPDSFPGSLDGKGQAKRLSLGGGVQLGEVSLGSHTPDRLPGSAASMTRPEDRSAGTGSGKGSRAGGAQPRFPAAAAAAARVLRSPAQRRLRPRANTPLLIRGSARDYTSAGRPRPRGPEVCTASPAPPARDAGDVWGQGWAPHDSIPARVLLA